jgi:LDH2 family malate/lactate/ureidoglycolate dehydrogenase
MAEHDVIVAWQPLRELAQELFTRAGMSAENAAIEADVLVWANLRGFARHLARADLCQEPGDGHL